MKPYHNTESDALDLSRSGGPSPAPDPNRGDTILLLGALSLFLCGPLGILAWLMANSDLRNVARGRIDGTRVGLVKAGRVLGILGTMLTPILVAVAVTFMAGLIPGTTQDPDRHGALKPDEMVFAGEWLSQQGSTIMIRHDGRADFRTAHTSVTGGAVRIEKDTLSIGLMGIYKTWTVRKRPSLQDGVWQMDLDGEIFIRREAGLLVKRTGSPRVVKPGLSGQKDA